MISSKDATPGQRLVILANWLQRRRGARWSVLLSEFGIVERSLRRALNDLRELGFEISEHQADSDRILFGRWDSASGHRWEPAYTKDGRMIDGVEACMECGEMRRVS